MGICGAVVVAAAGEPVRIETAKLVSSKQPGPSRRHDATTHSPKPQSPSLQMHIQLRESNLNFIHRKILINSSQQKIRSLTA